MSAEDRRLERFAAKAALLGFLLLFFGIVLTVWLFTWVSIVLIFGSAVLLGICVLDYDVFDYIPEKRKRLVFYQGKPVGLEVQAWRASPFFTILIVLAFIVLLFALA